MTVVRRRGKVSFDVDLGRSLKHEGMERATRGRPDAPEVDAYKDSYRAEFELQLASGEDFNSDTIVAVVGMPPEPASPNLIGGVFNGMLRRHRDDLEEVAFAQMKRPEAHARRTLLYRRLEL